jgi:hypothetical protein
MPNDPMTHVEMQGVRQDAKIIDDWRLNDAIINLTTHPCPMRLAPDSCNDQLLSVKVKRGCNPILTLMADQPTQKSMPHIQKWSNKKV